MFKKLMMLVILSVSLSIQPFAWSAAPLPGLAYHPEGDAIVIRNGTRWDNRPLYCNARQRIVMAGEMPGLSGQLGIFNAGVVRGNVRLQLDRFSDRVARYRPGRMEWDVTDPKLPGLAVKMTATTVPEGEGFVVQVQATGAMSGDELVWLYFVAGADKGAQAKTQPVAGGYKVGGMAVSLSDASVTPRPVEFRFRGDLDRLLGAAGGATQVVSGAAFVLPLTGDKPHQFAVINSPKPVEASRAFAEGLARVDALGD